MLAEPGGSDVSGPGVRRDAAAGCGDGDQLVPGANARLA
jgi:hypothetical protein